MDMNQVLQRIDVRRAELGLSDAALSIRAGGEKDLVRNWRRAVAKGTTIAPRTDKIELVAAALGVSVAFLTGEAPAAELPATGFSDHATPFQFNDTARPIASGPLHLETALRTLYAEVARTPATLRVMVSLPMLSMLAGDLVVMDLSRLPVPGEIAVVTITDEQTAQSCTRLCIYAPPLLIPGDQSPDSPQFRVDSAAVTVRHPVVAALRGFTRTA